MFWTAFTVYQIKKDPLLKLEKTTNKELLEKTKNYFIHEYSGEYNHTTMVLA